MPTEIQARYCVANINTAHIVEQRWRKKMINNKKTGSQFEKEFCQHLAENGWWAHFLTPSASGAQPFDIIALRGRDVYAIDCKTCADDKFPISRVEDNQWFAFRSIMWKSTNVKCGLAILYNDELYYVPFEDVLVFKEYNIKTIKLTERYKENARNCFQLN